MQSLESVAMRLDLRQGKNGCLLINDSYNSDVNSIQIALDFQQQRKMNRPLKKTVILSDILQTVVTAYTLREGSADDGATGCAASYRYWPGYWWV